jgi:hypothetical protein
MGPTAAVRLLPVVTAVLLILPVLAMARGALAMAGGNRPGDLVGWIGTGLSFLALLLGTTFFAYSIRYYLATILVLATTGSERRNGEAGNGNGSGNGHGNGLSRIAHRARGGNGVDEENGQLELVDEPFVSMVDDLEVFDRVLQRGCDRDLGGQVDHHVTVRDGRVEQALVLQRGHDHVQPGSVRARQPGGVSLRAVTTEVVEDDHPVAASGQMVRNIRTDEAGAAGHEDRSHAALN